MKSSFALLISIALFAAFALAAPTHIPAGNVQGEWTEQNSPYLIDGDIVVPEGQTLTIGSRVRVEFSGHYGIMVYGTLKTDIEEENRRLFAKDERNAIRFTADLALCPDGWAGLHFKNASDCRIESAIIENAHALATDAERDGAGALCENSTVTFANSVFRNNIAAGSGGALAVRAGKVSLANCTLSENSAAGQGGGIYAENTKVNVANCTIASNSATLQGGGVCAVNSSTLRVVNCTMSSNKSDIEGGGMYTLNSMVDLANGSLKGNEKGGVAMMQGSTVRLTNCTVRGNTNMEHGGGVYCSGSKVTITNGTVNDNDAGAIYLAEASNADLTNCTIRGNGSVRSVESDAASHVNMTNCVVRD